MEKALNGYLMFLKTAFRKKTTYAMLFILALLSVLLGNMEIPNSDNARVLLYGTDDLSKRIIEDIRGATSVFVFEKADSPEEIYREVKKTRADCGFIFDRDFEEKLESGNDAGIIENVITPYSVKGVVARERVYAAVLRHYSDMILDEQADEIFVDGEDAMKEAKQRSKDYLESDVLFDLDYEYVQTDSNYKEINGRSFMKTGKALPVHGVFSLMVVLMILFSDMESKFKRSSFFMINKKMIGLHNLAYVTPVAVLGFVMIRIFENVTPIWVDIILILLLVRLSITFSWIFTFPFKREESMISAILLFVIISLCITPVLFNVGDILPAAMFISAVTPNGAYLVCMELVLT